MVIRHPVPKSWLPHFAHPFERSWLYAFCISVPEAAQLLPPTKMPQLPLHTPVLPAALSEHQHLSTIFKTMGTYPMVLYVFPGTMVRYAASHCPTDRFLQRDDPLQSSARTPAELAIKAINGSTLKRMTKGVLGWVNLLQTRWMTALILCGLVRVVKSCLETARGNMSLFIQQGCYLWGHRRSRRCDKVGLVAHVRMFWIELRATAPVVTMWVDLTRTVLQQLLKVVLGTVISRCRFI